MSQRSCVVSAVTFISPLFLFSSILSILYTCANQYFVCLFLSHLTSQADEVGLYTPVVISVATENPFPSVSP